MKKLLFAVLFALSLSGYNIKEFVTCKDVQNLTPVTITKTFSVNDKKVFAFVYFTNIKKNSLIDFVWEKKVDGKWNLYADIQLPVYAGTRWRTYSNITIRPYFKGEWRVSLVDGNKTVKTVNFTVSDLNISK
jgi:hypothetical protein